QWIELTDDSHDLSGTPGTLVRLSKVDGTTLTVDPDTATGSIDRASFADGAKVRRWDSEGPITVQVAADDGWVSLEGGVEVRFEGEEFLAGDHWLIPARTLTSDVEWPTNGSNLPVPQPPHGIRHHRCRLALVQLDDEGWTVLTDCRSMFPSVTDLTELSYVGGDGQEATTDPASGEALLEMP